VWNMQNNWVTFGHVARSTTENQSQFNLLEILGNFSSMIGSQIGILNPIVAGLMVCAVIRSFGLRRNIHHAYLLAMSVPFFLIVAIVTLFKDIVPNWPAPTYFALVPLTAWFISHTWPTTKGWLIAVVISAVIFTPVMHYTTALYPWVPVMPRKWDPSYRLHGAQEIARAVSDELKTLEPGAFILGDRYQITALMAFYVTGQPRTYCIGSYIKNPANRDRLNQYDLWPDRALDQPGLMHRDAIYVGHEQPDLFEAFKHVERLPDVPVIRNGVLIRTQKLWKCLNFKGIQRPTDGLTKQ
jgi:hypothetical protein